MPPKGYITKKRRVALHVFALAIEANPAATQEQRYDWVVEHRTHWQDVFGWNVPERSRATDYLRELEFESTNAWLDTPWYTGIFVAHDTPELELPTDAVPSVMSLAIRLFAGGKRLSARQARWIARIRTMLPPIIGGTEGDIQMAYQIVLRYSAKERAATALRRATAVPNSPIPAGHESDTWAYDLMLAGSSPFLEGSPASKAVLWAGYDIERDSDSLRSWKDRDHLAFLGGLLESNPVANLKQLFSLKEREIDALDWRVVASALLRIRAAQTDEDWVQLSHEKQRDRAKHILEHDSANQESPA